jgi:hypothetical protein
MISHVLAALVVASLTYAAVIILYRLWLSPLSKIPGPKLGAITQGYEMYYDLILKARFPWQINALHQEYGKISL